MPRTQTRHLVAVTYSTPRRRGRPNWAAWIWGTLAVTAATGLLGVFTAAHYLFWIAFGAVLVELNGALIALCMIPREPDDPE